MATFPSYTNPWTSFTAVDDVQIISDIETISGKQVVVAGDNIRTNIKAQTRPLTEREYQFLQVFLKEIRGRGEFLLNVSEGSLTYFGTAVSPNAAFKVKNVYSAGSTIIELTTSPNLNTIPLGSYLQFREGGKLHQVLAVNGSNNTITISPSIYEPLTVNQSVLFQSLKGTYRIKGGVPTAEQSFIYRYQVAFEFEEVIK